MRARDLAGLLTLATLVGCATAPPEVQESPAAAQAPLDAPAPAQPQVEREATPLPAADDELGLAEYERMLAANEERLRAAGVLVAQREQQRAVGDGRFAQPPPASMPGDAALGGASPSGGAASRAKRKDSKTATATARPAAPKPTSTPNKTAKPAEEARPEPKAEDDADEAARGGRCQQICDLADATCDLSGKICDLAARHPGDVRYTGLCQRADDDCDLAAAACQRCSP